MIGSTEQIVYLAGIATIYQCVPLLRREATKLIRLVKRVRIVILPAKKDA